MAADTPFFSKCFFRPFDAEAYAIKWAEQRVRGPNEHMTEFEFMESFKPEGSTQFYEAITNPAVLSYVLCLREEDELEEFVNLCDAIRIAMRLAGKKLLGAFEFKLWCLFWVYTIGSEQNQIELYDILQTCHEKGLIEFQEDEITRAEELIHSIVSSTAHLEWEYLTGSPIYSGKPLETAETTNFWFMKLNQFAYAKVNSTQG